ncbi:MarR family winged helix-turn-helix transcriptional regulator [Paenibacillus bouchesdurhonensis]|uniref:MarR family winged helix-turn-helix transcriptional regulator n=1 Tax=Paenibacillus bouchesdurhonensis TaxID=1870990 RepID=UPI000DA60B97|nr:MarR family transcriptional regulator [Paenibacillus bouchesdurhonensis]
MPPLSRFEAQRFRYYILAAQRLGSRQLNEYMKKINLTASQSEVIQVLKQWEPVNLKDLGSLLVCETGSPSRLIDRMVQDGLVDKITDPTDARYVLLQLTDLGREKHEEIVHFENTLHEDLGTLFSDEELSAVSVTLEKLLSYYPIATTLRNRKLMKSSEENN